MADADNRNPHGFPEPLEGEPLVDWITRLREDQLERRTRGAPLPVAAYLETFPQLAGNREGLLDLIVHEIHLRREAGERPTREDYSRAFPDLVEEIDRQFSFDACMADLQAGDNAAEGDSPPPDPAAAGAQGQPTSPSVPPRFQIIRPLGKGGFGEVWLARDRKMKRPVALKFPQLDPGRPELLARFHRETETAAQLNHPNLCTLHERFWDHDPPFLVLEYVDGLTLTEAMNDPQPFPLDRAVDIIAAAATGVYHAHQRNIIHRDLKPENIKIRKDGIVKVLDFGLAKPLTGGLVWLTPKEHIPGTVPYMAPEQLRGDPSTVGPAADQYALGVILYQVITGKHPFLDENETDYGNLLWRIAHGDFKAPRELRGDIDEALNSIVLRMMRKEPGERFGSLGEAVSALSAYRQGNRVPVPLPKANRHTTVAVVAGILVVALGAFALWPRAGQAPEHKPPTPSAVVHAPEDLMGLLEVIRRDLDGIDVDEQRYQRYFSLAHLRHAPGVGSSVLRQHRDALTELLQALHFGDSAVPKTIDAEGLLLRLDLRKMNWLDDVHWHELQRSNPYALQFPPDSTTQALRNIAVEVNRKSGTVDGGLPAFLRGDWFIVTFTEPERAKALLSESPATAAQIAERLQRVAVVRERTGNIRDLYARPLGLADVCRELGWNDREAVRQAILASPELSDILGLRPLTEGKTIDRAVWSRCDTVWTSFGALAMQLKLGRRKLVN